MHLKVSNHTVCLFSDMILKMPLEGLGMSLERKNVTSETLNVTGRIYNAHKVILENYNLF